MQEYLSYPSIISAADNGLDKYAVAHKIVAGLRNVHNYIHNQHRFCNIYAPAQPLHNNLHNVAEHDTISAHIDRFIQSTINHIRELRTLVLNERNSFRVNLDIFTEQQDISNMIVDYLTNLGEYGTKLCAQYVRTISQPVCRSLINEYNNWQSNIYKIEAYNNNSTWFKSMKEILNIDNDVYNYLNNVLENSSVEIVDNKEYQWRLLQDLYKPHHDRNLIFEYAHSTGIGIRDVDEAKLIFLHNPPKIVRRHVATMYTMHLLYDDELEREIQEEMQIVENNRNGDQEDEYTNLKIAQAQNARKILDFENRIYGNKKIMKIYKIFQSDGDNIIGMYFLCNIYETMKRYDHVPMYMYFKKNYVTYMLRLSASSVLNKFAPNAQEYYPLINKIVSYVNSNAIDIEDQVTTIDIRNQIDRLHRYTTDNVENKLMGRGNNMENISDNYDYMSYMQLDRAANILTNHFIDHVVFEVLASNKRITKNKLKQPFAVHNIMLDNKNINICNDKILFKNNATICHSHIISNRWMHFVENMGALKSHIVHHIIKNCIHSPLLDQTLQQELANAQRAWALQMSKCKNNEMRRQYLTSLYTLEHIQNCKKHYVLDIVNDATNCLSDNNLRERSKGYLFLKFISALANSCTEHNDTIGAICHKMVDEISDHINELYNERLYDKKIIEECFNKIIHAYIVYSLSPQLIAHVVQDNFCRTMNGMDYINCNHTKILSQTSQNNEKRQQLVKTVSQIKDAKHTIRQARARLHRVMTRLQNI